jgi:hypothetical protein
MSLSDALAALGQSQGAPRLALDESGHAAFVTGVGQHVELQAPDGGSSLSLLTAVGVLRPGDNRQLLLELLRANATFIGLFSPCFALSPSTREVLLTLSVPVSQCPADAAPMALVELLECAGRAKKAFSSIELQMD